MRKIETRIQRERSDSRRKAIVGIVLVGILLLSTLGFALQSSLENGVQQEVGKIEYNGVEFTQSGAYWLANGFIFRYNPEQTDFPTNDLAAGETYSGVPVYLQSEDSAAEIEVYVNMAKIAQRVNPACEAGSDCAEGLPVKTCADKFIIIKESEKSSIRQQEGCVYIEGKKEDLVAMADEFLFRILGVK